MFRRGSSIGLAGMLVLAIVAPVAAHSDHATLIDVHAISVAKARPGPAVANCSNDGASSGVYALTGWTVQGSQTAHFNTSTVPGGLSGSAVANALQTGFSAWKVSGASVPTISVATDGTTTKYAANHRYELMFGRTGGSTTANDRFETMYAYGYTGETLKWSPANGDVAGIQNLY